MLTPARKTKLINSLKGYSKKYLCGRLNELDESGTRIMINSFLSDVLGFAPLDEIKTEYMIRGTYADYLIQTKGTRHFLVEVKSLSLDLSEKHLRQVVNYAANEGIDWVLLTNGKVFALYRILFNKPIESRKMWEFDVTDPKGAKDAAEEMQYLHRDVILKNSLQDLWNRKTALDPSTIGGLLYSEGIVSSISKALRVKYNTKFTDQEIKIAITRLISDSVDPSLIKIDKPKAPKKKPVITQTELVQSETTNV